MQPVDGAKWRRGGGGERGGERTAERESHGAALTTQKGCMGRFVIDSTDGVLEGDRNDWSVRLMSPYRRYVIR